MTSQVRTGAPGAGGPALLEGGDVMRIGKTLYVGRSGRTNFQGIQQLAQIVESAKVHVAATLREGKSPTQAAEKSKDRER